MGEAMRLTHASVAAAAVASTLGAAWVALETDRSSHRVLLAVFGAVVSLSFAGSGLHAWIRQPRNRLGPLMILISVAWSASMLFFANGALVYTIGQALRPLFVVGLLYLLLSFPTGRLATTYERVLVGSMLVVLLPLQIVWMLPAEGDPVLCKGCPRNLLEVGRDDHLTHVIGAFQGAAGTLVLFAAVVVLVRRWRASGAAERRAIAPVAVVGGVLMVAAVLVSANFAAGSPLGFLPLLIAWCAFAVLPVAIVAMLVQRRLARSAIAGLVIDLGDRPKHMALRDALARALGDPSLDLVYWAAETGRYVDAQGGPAALPEAGGARVVTAVQRGGEPAAALVHDRALLENPELIDSVCAAAALALENERLQAELRSRLTELQASRARLVEAADAERVRIERDLHDGAQQRLVSIAMALGLAEARFAHDAEAARPILREARDGLALALEELRELSRGILPGILTERGLTAALGELSNRASVPVRLSSSIDGRLPEHVEAAAYFLVSEALANIAKHSHASSARIHASVDDGVLAVDIEDDGIGGAAIGGGSGLRGLTDRVEALGGRLTVSSPPGRGTVVRAEIPCA
jgi:signal transduction histidine kinase